MVTISPSGQAGPRRRDPMHSASMIDPNHGGTRVSVFNVGFVIFPDLTQLDFAGPQQVLARLPESAMHIVAKTLDLVPSDSGLSLMPTHTFEDCPPLDLICVPGGYRGVIQAMADQDLIEFVQRQARTAKYVTSVCTGAFILGAAGLLKGRPRRPEGRENRSSGSFGHLCRPSP
jgi:transcriptional regulator GlxA family with amidase domain